MSPALDPSTEDAFLRRSPTAAPHHKEFRIAGVAIRIDSDDPAFLDEFGRVFGERPSPALPAVATLRATVVAHQTGEQGALEVDGDDLTDPAAFLLQFASPTVPFVRLEANGDATRVGIEGYPHALFTFRGAECLFAKHPRWRRIVAHFLFLRALRLRSDLLFFHAASVRVGKSGALLIGPKGTGKTTLSLAIGAAGHDLLGDETAAYDRVNGTLLPMRRPASIKPGVRSRSVDDLLRLAAPPADEDGLLHVAPDDLFGASDVDAAPLRAVFFLGGFAAAPRVEPVVAGREELASMQPLRCSSLADAPSRNVMAMIRMLNGVRCYRLQAGDPDETANLMIEVLRHDAHSQ